MNSALSSIKGTHGSRALIPFLLAAATGTAMARPDIYTNGPYVTHPSGGAGGAGLSAVQTVLFNTMYGASNQQSPANDRTADDFTLAAPATITSVVVYGFQSNASTSASPFTGINVQVWSGRPGDPGAEVVYGDTTTNRLLAANWANCFRARDDSPGSTQRPIYAIEAVFNPPLSLPEGTYWLDWQVSGVLSGGPSAAVVTLPGQTGALNANARWKQGSSSNWIYVVDGGSLARQDLAFTIRGNSGGGPPPCYPNCDGTTTSPVLSANDFQCFLNSFATNGSYANCDGSTTPPVLNANDFQCFLNRFAVGCS
jgi:hypothetical protein